MKNSELQKMKIQTEQGVFFPAYTYSNKIDIKNKDGEVVDYEYVDFILYKTAEEVYQEYLNPLPPEPTEMDLMKQKLESQDKVIEEFKTSNYWRWSAEQTKEWIR